MALWKKLWLLFTVMWVIVAGLNALSIVAFGDEIPAQKALLPLFFGIAVPAVLYGIGWLWERWRKSRKSVPGTDS